MRLFPLYEALLLPCVALGLAVPRHMNPGMPFRDNGIAGPIASDGLSIFFSAPCHGCFDNNDELEFELKVEASNGACEPSSMVLNGVRLATVADANVHGGNVLFTTASPTPREVLSSWEMSCLGDEITLLSLHIVPLPGRYEILEPSGFAVSFKQGERLDFLRLELTPVSDINDVNVAQHWTSAQDSPEFVIVPSTTINDQNFSDEIQRELRELYEIKATIGRLHHRYMRQEHFILDMIKQDFYACHGARCLFQTAIKKAPDFFELLKAHFRHRPDWSKHHGHDLNFDKMHDFQIQPERDVPLDQDSPAGSTPMEAFSADHSPCRPLFDEPQSHGPPSPPPPPPPSPDHRESGPGDHPPPPPPPPHGHKGHPPFPWQHPPGHHRPHFWHHHGPHRHPFFFSLGSISVFIIVASLLFRVVRKKTGLFRSERRRRDRAARREECRNRAAYRTAAMRHQWKRWWSQLRQPESTGDYEEKRSRILEQENLLEDVMQSEISDLRRAHEIVDEMMRADGRRHRLFHQANFGGTSQAVAPVISADPSRPDEREDVGSAIGTLPLYQPPPPSYEQELEGDMMVVDGFTYTPSQTDSTIDSSVVDCNSRMSFDTSSTITKD